MTGADRLDACRDAAALLECAARHDSEGAEVLLGHGDTRAIAAALAGITATALTVAFGAEFLGELCRELRIAAAAK